MHSEEADLDPMPHPPRKQRPPSSRDRRKSANQPRDRLLSIQYDVEQYLKPLLQKQRRIQVVANERCGTWYATPFQPHSYCHFKSTDGHVHLFSLKRLNLPLLKTLAEDEGDTSTSINGQCNHPVWIIDASNKKEMPDSFSRTLPIWACVLNRIAEIYRKDLGLPSLFSNADTRLILPTWIVPKTEQTTMHAAMDARVQELYQSQAIVDVPGFLSLMTKPLRPFWITPLHAELPTEDQTFFCRPIICCNASNVRLGGANESRIVWREEGQFWYTPGAADDHESWARRLIPQLFWKREKEFSSSLLLSNQETEDWIDKVMKMASSSSLSSQNEEEDNHDICFDWIGNLNLAIGSRRAGRPPHCWKHFDAVLNVTNTEYDEMRESTNSDDSKFYLQLPVEEGKRDKHELERWMAVGVLFCAIHARQKRRVLIHCAQGRDRSVAIAMAMMQLFCSPMYPLSWNWQVLEASGYDILAIITDSQEEGERNVASMRATQAGLPPYLASVLFYPAGRDKLLNIVRGHLGKSAGEPLASKESLRVVLHLIRQDREKAEPSRATMQKLNRFFMSDAYKKTLS